ncbi:MAG: ABC transporter ATP-binding protein [Candidatus Marinimicrobia bacterium]|nr:ABC transporter ATP-binding protein [Candidatus Neomarinimicrobiota bacterium]
MISIRHLKKQFGDLLAVDDLSLDVHEGEILGFLGPNGAGKTTTIRMLCGLLRPDDGKIYWKDDQQTPAIEVGFCPQENIFWPKLSCFEQLVFMAQINQLSKSDAEGRAHQLLEDLGLTEKADVLAEKLSGGMKRRLNIALALAHDPDILILDEPETGLDPQSRVLVRDLIRALAKTKTILLTTHNMDEAERLADRVAIIDHGRLLKLDTVENLRKSVGEGELLEIKAEALAKDDISGQQIKTALSGISQEITIINDTLQIRNIDVLSSLNEITRILDEHQLVGSEMHMRKSTLEDVFIHLTGRTLRE